MCAKSWSTFFDSQDDAPKARPSQPAGPRSDSPGEGEITVAALVAKVKNALTGAFPGRLSVVGEISNFTRHSSGHLYFSLKDADATIDVVMWRSAADKLKFQPTDGLEVVATGRVDVYEVRGQLQLYVTRMTPRGQGELELAFRQLREKLQAKGLFDAAAKKPICRFPRAIGVVTSPTGAAVRDIARTIRRRWRGAQVYLAPTSVQGQGAAESIAQAIRLLDSAAVKYCIDTIIVSRGGGSLEDLWAFNEQCVAEAIFAASTPIISGVGHEVDITIADLVADYRAATPTAAAESAAPDAAEVNRHLQVLSVRLGRSVTSGLKASRTRLEGLRRSAMFRDPAGRLRTHVQHIDELSHRLEASLRSRLSEPRRTLEETAGRLAANHPARLSERCAARLAQVVSRLAWVGGGMCKRAADKVSAAETALRGVHPKHRCKLARQHVDSLARQLEALSYRSVLARGFSVTRTSKGVILKQSGDVEAGEDIITELAEGSVSSRVTAGGGGGGDGLLQRPPKRPARKRREAVAPGPLLFDVDTDNQA